MFCRNWSRDDPVLDAEDAATEFDDLPWEEQLRIRREQNEREPFFDEDKNH